MNSLPQDSIPHKRCSNCPEDDQWHPATPEFFVRNKNSKDGLYSQCKKCTKAYKDRYRQENKHILLMKQKEYAATHREQEQARQKKYRDRNKEQLAEHGKRYREKNRDKLTHKSKLYYRDNKEQLLEKQKRYHSEHREERRETRREYTAQHKIQKKNYDREYWHKNKERISDYKKNYAKNNRDRMSQRDRQYYLDHREALLKRVRQHSKTEQGKMMRRAAHQRRRARKKDVAGSCTAAQLQGQMERQKSKCYWCQKKIGKGKGSWHADHIVPLSKSGSNNIDNIVIACPTCNMRKNAKLPHEWPEGGRLC